MKLFAAIVLSLLVLQSLAMPAPEENSDAVEHMPRNEIVEQFRTEIIRQLLRYQNLYDRANAAMNGYRVGHVRLINMVYDRLMTVFGDDIEAIRQSAYELIDLIEHRHGQLGRDNPCLLSVTADFGQNSARIGNIVNTCAIYANTTLSTRLGNVFYPTFANIIDNMATVPLAVVNALARGNVLQDEQEIIEYLNVLYESKDAQWMSAVSQLLRWETNRFEVDGLFLVDEMTMCMAPEILDFIDENVRLEIRAQACT